MEYSVTSTVVTRYESMQLRSLRQSERTTEGYTGITNKNELHKRKGQKFYEVKQAARLKSRKSEYKEAICMDFQKNYQFQTFQLLRSIIIDSCPFILVTYIRCQQEYIYDQSKGSDEVCCKLWHHCMNIVPSCVGELLIFYDSCSGQNRNFTVFRFCHYVVHTKKRFDAQGIIFPTRGHSYLECDKNMGLVNQRARCEVPDDWRQEIANSRRKPNHSSL
ncbi:hypothetical protein ANN_16393 [Periplaneta americana]|uniref:Uncharacterized protein n=1 Tax=Periplaneta americana TaxID=6978 RepID=A0ABQ8SJM6_PERAM|nr:hypothetical protein ANN_16393 [Periplaneta americana]